MDRGVTMTMISDLWIQRILYIFITIMDIYLDIPTQYTNIVGFYLLIYLEWIKQEAMVI